MDASSPAPDDQPPAPRSLFRERWIIPALLVLTLIAGLLRFNALDRPVIWGDEAATAGRIVGTYQDLLDQLADSSFTPLHYEMGWWIQQGLPYWGTITEKQSPARSGDADGAPLTERIFEPTHRLIEGGVKMTPFMLRLVPALAGTLMIPAIYFLSRQMFGPRISLLAAAFCCFSAFLLIYSRDAKMYMPFWLLCTLNLGCLLWWIRVRTWTAWLCWIAAGAGMMGYHGLGAFVLAINVLIFIGSPRQHWLGLLKILGLICWPILLAAAGLYQLAQRRWNLMVWWRFENVLRWPLRVWPAFRFPAILSFVAGVMLIMLGTQLYRSEFKKVSDRVVAEDGTFSTNDNGTGWVERYNEGRDFLSLMRYTGSVYLSGWEWAPTPLENRRENETSVPPLRLKLLKASVTAAAVLLAIGLIPWRRILSPARERLERISQDGRVDPAFVRRRVIWIGLALVIPAYLLYSQSVQWPATVLDGVSSVLLKEPSNIQWPRLERAGKDDDKLDFYTSSERYDAFAKRFGEAMAAFQRQFAVPDNVAWPRICFIGIALALLIALAGWRYRGMGRTTLRFAISAAIILALCAILAVMPRFPDQSQWMPRYLGFVFPAFSIAMAAIIARQPTWWLRGATILLLLVLNLGQYTLRVYGDSEPPSDRIAADIIRSQPKDILSWQDKNPTFRTYISLNRSHSGAEPGKGTFPTPPTNYYLWLDTQLSNAARQIRQNTYQNRLRISQVFNPSDIVSDMERSPKIERFTLWTSFDTGKVDTTDRVGDALKGKFRRVSDETIAVYDHWRWIQWFNLRRREYVRIS